MNSSKRISHMIYLTMLLALGVVFHMAEGLITLPTIPGVRFGFANVIGLMALYSEDGKTMFEINLARVLFASLLSGSFLSTGFYLSLCGVTLCTIVSILAKATKKFSILGVSMISGIFHGIGQILAVMVIYKTTAMVLYLPVLTLTAIPTGLFTGYIAYLVLKNTKKGDFS